MSSGGQAQQFIGDGQLNWKQREPGRELEAAQVIENVVARDGLEPPTPAFSGLRSTT
jgi:hypothetical protein